MSSLETHLRKAETFREGASRVNEPGLLVEVWFLSAYHLIEACAAKKRVHIQKHQRVPDALQRNSTILGPHTSTAADAFRYLDHNASQVRLRKLRDAGRSCESSEEFRDDRVHLSGVAGMNPP